MESNSEQQITEMEKLEYQEGSKVCMHYEQLRRQGLTFFWIVQAAFIVALFGGDSSPNLELKILLPLVAVFVSWATLNNDIRVIGYYWVYIERIRAIEAKCGMNLYSDGRPKVDKLSFSIPNNFFFRAIPVGTGFIWLVYLAWTLIIIIT